MLADLYKNNGKRIFDVVFSLSALIVLLPFMLLTALFIKITSKGPIFYKQKRIGQNFKPFFVYKFRTMIVDADKKGLLVTVDGDPRITKIGKILRKLKFDELPQFLNVLKGEMSVVGPRPEVEKYVYIKENEYKKILSIKPGITDFATLEFRDEEDIMKKYSNPEKGYIDEVLPIKISLYNKYIESISLFTDIKLIIITYFKAFFFYRGLLNIRILHPDDIKKNKLIFDISFFVLILILTISWGKRYWQYTEWENKKETYFYEDTVSMTTLDGYYWIRLAKELNDPEYKALDKDKLRGYPDNELTKGQQTNNLLVYSIAKFNNLFDNYYITGIFLTFFYSSLFIIPLFLYFYHLGIGAAGITGAFFGTFSYAYYYRSYVGRVDTDTLNLFFPIMISYLIFLISKINQSKYKYIAGGFAGLFGYFFMWWYRYPGFIVGYFIILTIFLAMTKHSMKQIIIISGLFIVCSNPINFYNGLLGIKYFFTSKYFSGEILYKSGVAWPNIAEVTSETINNKLSETFVLILGNETLCIIGIIGMLMYFIFNLKNMIPLLPSIFLGLLTIKSSNRFAMYITPFAAAGLGYWLYLLMKVSLNKLQNKEFLIQLSSYILALFTFFFFSQKITAYNYLPEPSVPVEFIKNIKQIKQLVPKNSVVLSWWDYGYPLTDIGGFATYHDGGINGSERTYLVAKQLVSDNQTEFANSLKYIDRLGFNKIKSELSKGKNIYEILNNIKSYNGKLSNKDTYIMLSEDMIYKYDGIEFFGNWNFDTKKSIHRHFKEIHYNGIKNDMINFKEFSLNLKTGSYNSGKISRLIIVDNGSIIENRNYSQDGDVIEIINFGKENYASYKLPIDMYKGNYNQMFVLKNYDKNMFELVHDDYPYLLLYRIK